VKNAIRYSFNTQKGSLWNSQLCSESIKKESENAGNIPRFEIHFTLSNQLSLVCKQVGRDLFTHKNIQKYEKRIR
jgi:hypothetical protein